MCGQVTADGNLEVCWSDEHEGTFPATWLHDRAFTTKIRDQRNTWYDVPLVRWGSADMQGKIPTQSYDKVSVYCKCVPTW